jgi:hypothetical protein
MARPPYRVTPGGVVATGPGHRPGRQFDRRGRRRRDPATEGTAGYQPSPVQTVGGRPTFEPWDPYERPDPPSGTYDPGLDAARGAAGRGLGDLREDTEIADTRDRVDYGIQREGIQRNWGRAAEDIGTQQQGLRTTHQRGLEDFGRQRQTLERAALAAGNRQRQTINAAGVYGGGASLQAAAKRAQLEALDREQIRTAESRFTEDIAGREAGLRTGIQRGQQDRDLGLAALALEYAPPGEGGPLGGRRYQDRARTLERAGREDLHFGLDTDAQREYQAAQSGYEAPRAPRNEHVDEQGRKYRVEVVDGVEYRIAPDGSVIGKRRLPRDGGEPGYQVTPGGVVATGPGHQPGRQFDRRGRRPNQARYNRGGR